MPLNISLVDATLVVAWLNISSVVSACWIGVNRCIILCIGSGRRVPSMPLKSLLLDATLVVAWLNISSVVSLDIYCMPNRC